MALIVFSSMHNIWNSQLTIPMPHEKASGKEPHHLVWLHSLINVVQFAEVIAVGPKTFFARHVERGKELYPVI
jgi:hypothetical protein